MFELPKCDSYNIYDQVDFGLIDWKMKRPFMEDNSRWAEQLQTQSSANENSNVAIATD